MTKKDLYEGFGGEISKLAIVRKNSEWVIQGKNCVIAFIGDNTYDLWICDPDDPQKGLGHTKVRNIVRILLKSAVGTKFRELNGEADTKVQGTDLILQNLNLLGIRKKRYVSDKTAEEKVILFSEHRRRNQ